MIEVEKKFQADANVLARLLDGAHLEREKINIDIYFDTTDYRLSAQWFWLRKRNGMFELKVPTQPVRDGKLCDVFMEYERDSEIRAAIGLPESNMALEVQLASEGFVEFAHLTTRRMSYTKDGFHIDVDETTAKDFSSRVIEIELMVADKSEISAAETRIANFAMTHGLEMGFTRGKLLAYIVEKNPAQLAVLRANGFSE